MTDRNITVNNVRLDLLRIEAEQLRREVCADMISATGRGIVRLMRRSRHGAVPRSV